jgi:tRNA-specific 2-thiouridylase
MRIVVAMSGGVDSSVTAALLQEAGHEVIGITLQLYDHGAAVARKGACCAGQDIHDARAVADRLGISHYVLDFEDRFRKAVIEDFADTYAAGRTPVPCIRCNQRIKFRDLLEVARDLGAEALATGHYARRLEGADGPELHRAIDASRDQSYFLFATTAEQLGFVRFPLGELPKPETRRHAARLGLPVAEKPDSQDICFVPSGHYSELVGKLRPETLIAGEFVGLDGRKLGEHAGVASYTVGQRRGLGLTAAERLYVVGIDAASRRVTVAPRARATCLEVELAEASWLARPSPGTLVRVKHRANEPAVPAMIGQLDGCGGRLRFERAQVGVAPGQACVVYQGSRVLGGGWIRTAPLLAAA